MTSLVLQVEGDESGSDTAKRSTGELVEHVAMLLLLVVWAVPLARADGGRGAHMELVFALVLVPIMAAVCIWRAPSRTLIAATVLGLVSMAVCLFAPTGWAGGDTAAGYVLTAVVFAVARRFVRDDDINRRALVASGICLAGSYQFALGFQTWWSGRDPAAEVIGSFDAHNPFAVFLMPAAIIGLSLIAERRAPWQLVGWISVPLCTAGIVLSSSRATLAVTVVGCLIVLAASARSRPAALRVVGALVLAAALTAVLPGPPFFTHRSSPFASTSARASSGETLSRNGQYRSEFWREAAKVAEHHPVTGAGYHSLETAGALYAPTSWPQTSYALNGYLQTVSDGGLLLALPWFAALLMVAYWCFRRLWLLLGRRTATPSDVVTVGIAVALLGALAHSMVDFEWAYPLVTMELALMAACVATPVSNIRSKRSAALSVTGTVALVALLAVSVPALHQWQADTTTAGDSATQLLAASNATFGDYRPAETLLNGVAAGEITATRPQVQRALALTAAEAKIDITSALIRYTVLAKLRLDPRAGLEAQDLVSSLDGITSEYASSVAFVYLSAGQPTLARDVLARDIAAQVKAGAASAYLRSDFDVWAQHFGRGAAYACQLKTVAGLPGAPALSTLPAATAQCSS